jgi:hypothetical protein
MALRACRTGPLLGILPACISVGTTTSHVLIAFVELQLLVREALGFFDITLGMGHGV